MLTRTSLFISLLAGAAAAQTTVRDADAFRRAVTSAKPGAVILVAPGEYAGGFWFEKVEGKEGSPVVIAGADPKNPPVFRGGTVGLHFARTAHLEIRDIDVTGATGNGISIDDGGDRLSPAHHVVLKRVKVSAIGARGNEDGLKMSGVDDFLVENCTFTGWGTGGGSAVDMVGCHRGRVEGCTFRHPEASNGVQMKGGTSKVTVSRCRFDDAGSRAINIGGSTGLQFFRPPLDKAPFAEARDIMVSDNTFTGSDTPVAFVGVDGAIVMQNTIYLPRRWALRILQETTAEGFVPCRGGVFSRNIVVFKIGNWSEGGVNVGPGTDPESFRFEDNAWFCLDAPARSTPKLPSPEKGGRRGDDPRFLDPENGDFRLADDSPVRFAGVRPLPR